MTENSLHERHKQNPLVTVALAIIIAAVTIALVAVLTQVALAGAEWFINTV